MVKFVRFKVKILQNFILAMHVLVDITNLVTKPQTYPRDS